GVESILTQEEVLLFLNKNSKNNNFQLSSDKDGILTYYEKESGRLAFFRKGFTNDKSLPMGKLRILDEEESAKLIKSLESCKEQLDKL
ncbi:hypothetical protein EBX31_12905, partial [bacterium]|nr:hypothetical protein [bacterium]